MHDCRFVENIPRHITPKSGFESFAEYTQCIQEGPFRLEATADIPAGEEVYVRHAPGDIQWSCFHPNGCTSGTLKALYAQYGYVTVLFHCHPAMLEQVLLTTSPIVCSAVNATVAFILVALVRITHVYLAPGALRLCVVVWIFHPVFQLPLLQGFFFFFVFGVNFFLGILHTIFVPNICLHVCFPDHSKKDEIKSMGDVKSELVKKVSKTHMKRKYLSQLYKDHDPSDLPIQSDEELPYDSPLKS